MASARLLPSLVSVGPLGDTCFSRAETAAWDPSPHARQETGQGQPARPRARGGRRCLPGSRLLGLLRLLTGLCVSVSVCPSPRGCQSAALCSSLPVFLPLRLPDSLFLCPLRCPSAPAPQCPRISALVFLSVPFRPDESPLLPERATDQRTQPRLRPQSPRLSFFILGF